MAQSAENPPRDDAPAAAGRYRRRRIGQRGLIIVGAGLPLLALLAVLAWGSFSSGGGPAGAAVNATVAEVRIEPETAPDFTLARPDGGEIRLSDLRGQVTLLDFWASWCRPCRDEAPALAQAYQEYQERGVEFVGVNLWDDPSDARRFLQEQGHQYPNGIDADGKIAISYGVRGIPEKFFINRHGQIVRKFSGPMTLELLRRILDDLLAQP